jgi:hypothetical protein
MNITIEEIMELARKELVNLKTNATAEEWNRLCSNLDVLNGGKCESCAYGLITGSCHSERALVLMEKCVVEQIFFDALYEPYELASTLMVEDSPFKPVRNFTALEFYLYGYKEDVEQMILELDQSNS